MIDNNPKSYLCRSCGNEFTSIGYHVYYCTDCRKQKRKEIAAAAHKKYYKPKMANHTCPICGKEFIGTVKQTYCSIKCSKIAQEADMIPVKQSECFTFRANIGSKIYLDKIRKKMKLRSVNQLLREALLEYIKNNITDKELLDELYVLIPQSELLKKIE